MMCGYNRSGPAIWHFDLSPCWRSLVRTMAVRADKKVLWNGDRREGFWQINGLQFQAPAQQLIFGMRRSEVLAWALLWAAAAHVCKRAQILNCFPYCFVSVKCYIKLSKTCGASEEAFVSWNFWNQSCSCKRWIKGKQGGARTWTRKECGEGWVWCNVAWKCSCSVSSTNQLKVCASSDVFRMRCWWCAIVRLAEHDHVVLRTGYFLTYSWCSDGLVLIFAAIRKLTDDDRDALEPHERLLHSFVEGKIEVSFVGPLQVSRTASGG